MKKLYRGCDACRKVLTSYEAVDGTLPTKGKKKSYKCGLTQSGKIPPSLFSLLVGKDLERLGE